MMRAYITVEATAVDTGQDFFISHGVDVSARHKAVSTMFLACVRRDPICHRRLHESRISWIGNADSRGWCLCGDAMPSLRIRGELEPFHAWDRTRLGRPSIFDGIPRAPHMVPTPAGICPDGGEKGVHGPVGSALGGEKVCQRVRGTRSSGPSIDPLFPDGLAIRIRPGLLLFPSFDVGDHRRCQKNQ